MGRRLVAIDAAFELALGAMLVTATGARWLGGSDFASALPSSALVVIGALLLGSGAGLSALSRTRSATGVLPLLGAGNGLTAAMALVWAAAGRPPSLAAAAISWSAGLALAALAAIQLRAFLRSSDPRRATIAG